MPRANLRLPVMLAAPLLAALLELFHPKAPLAQLFADPALLARWQAVHVLQLFLFALCGAAVYLLVDGESGLAPALARLASGGFAVFYGAYDALAGIATGVLGQAARAAPAGGAAGMEAAGQALFAAVENGRYAWIGLLGAAFWVLALLAAGVTVARPGRPGLALGLAALTAFAATFGKDQLWRGFVVVTVLAVMAGYAVTVAGRRRAWVPCALLALSALALTSGHPAPFGTIAFGALWLAICWCQWKERGRNALSVP